MIIASRKAALHKALRSPHVCRARRGWLWTPSLTRGTSLAPPVLEISPERLTSGSLVSEALSLSREAESAGLN